MTVSLTHVLFASNHIKLWFQSSYNLLPSLVIYSVKDFGREGVVVEFFYLILPISSHGCIVN